MTSVSEILSAERSGRSDRAALIEAFEQNRERLLRLISLRLDSRLSGRVDPSDVYQETFLRASAAYDEYCQNASLPLYNWIRMQAQFAVGDCHRTHLGTQKRTAGLEQRYANPSSVEALEGLAKSMISPGSQVANADLAQRVREIICGMNDIDREILMLRHVEELTIAEAAAELQIETDTAKKRHLRALRRLRELCAGLSESSAG